jgi:hypothetical protein
MDIDMDIIIDWGKRMGVIYNKSDIAKNYHNDMKEELARWKRLRGKK